MAYLQFMDVNTRSQANKISDEKIETGYKTKINAFYENDIRRYSIVWWKEEKSKRNYHKKVK